MTILKKSIFFLVVCGTISACGTAPVITIYFISPGVMQYYVPKTQWTVKGVKAVRAELDITYRNNRTDPSSMGTFNISFFNTQKNFHEVSSAFFTHDEAAYPLKDIMVIYAKAINRELRVSSKINREDMIAALSAEPVLLTAVIDGVAYQFEPSKKFITLKNQLLEELTY